MGHSIVRTYVSMHVQRTASYGSIEELGRGARCIVHAHVHQACCMYHFIYCAPGMAGHVCTLVDKVD